MLTIVIIFLCAGDVISTATSLEESVSVPSGIYMSVFSFADVVISHKINAAGSEAGGRNVKTARRKKYRSDTQTLSEPLDDSDGT